MSLAVSGSWHLVKVITSGRCPHLKYMRLHAYQPGNATLHVHWLTWQLLWVLYIMSSLAQLVWHLKSRKSTSEQLATGDTYRAANQLRMSARRALEWISMFEGLAIFFLFWYEWRVQRSLRCCFEGKACMDKNCYAISLQMYHKVLLTTVTGCLIVVVNGELVWRKYN